MLDKISSIFFRHNKQIFLKNRLITVILLSAFIPLVLIGSISYYSISSIQKNKIQNGIQNNLKQEIGGLDNTLNNIDYVSKQLAITESTGYKIEALMETDDIYEKYKLIKEIKKSDSMIYNSNPNVGVVFYYFPGDRKILFENQEVDKDFDFIDFPLISEDRFFSLYGPHKSLSNDSKNMVFSIVRKVDISCAECYIYVETNFTLFDELLKKEQYGLDVSHIILDNTGKIVFSELESDFPTGK